MKLTPLLLGLGTGEIIFIVLIFLLLFGAKRIPELMKSMGKGVKNFKEGMKEVEKEINAPATDETAAKEPSKDAEPQSK
jgi:sec-independent protein translocase protein TatA